MFSRRNFLKKLAVFGGVVLTPASLLGLPKNLNLKTNYIQVGNFILKSQPGFYGKDNVGAIQRISSWKNYIDSEFGISFKYPTEWDFFTQIKQTAPYDAPNAILKRDRFYGPGGVIDLDIWDAHGYDLVDWMNWWHNWAGASREVYEPEQPNAKVFQSPAIMFLEPGNPDLLKLFLSIGNYSIRLTYSILDPTYGLEVFSTIVNTLTSKVKEKTTPVLPFMEINSAIYPMVASCCGYSSGSGNPFPCQCSSDPNKTGNCTWWVYYSYGSVPFTGDAKTWWGQVPNYQYWARKTGTPPTNDRSIAWWNSGTQVGGTYGHVAYIANYTSGSTFNCTEMMWCATFNCMRSHSYATSSPGGYIYDTYP